MQSTRWRPRAGRRTARATGGDGAATRRGTTRAAGVLAATAGLLVSGLVVGSPAEAASSAVTIKTIASRTVAPGSTVTVKPRYAARKGVKVRSVTMSVRRSSSWMTRGARWIKLPPGTYRVTTKVAYRDSKSSSRSKVRTKSRTQTLRVLTPPPVISNVTPPVDYATQNASIAKTGLPCDASSVRKADGTPWVCTFSDDFSGTSLDTTKWLPQLTETSGYTIGGDCYLNRPGNVSVAGGSLALTVRKESAPFTCKSPLGDFTSSWTGGMVSTWTKFAQTSGRFEIRAAFPATTVPGHHSALWLFPQASPYGTFPYSGEIDIAEMYSQWSDRAIPFIHYGASATDPSVTNNYCMIKDVSQYHTYTLEWTSTTMTIAFDGKPCVTHTINGLTKGLGSAPFDTDFIMVLTQGLGLGGNAPVSSTPVSGTTKVDYVRIWK